MTTSYGQQLMRDFINATITEPFAENHRPAWLNAKPDIKMSSPQPINAVQTRVVKMPHGHYADFSTDGLTWHPLGQFSNEEAAIYHCEIFQEIAAGIPYIGDVVWRSKG